MMTFGYALLGVSLTLYAFSLVLLAKLLFEYGIFMMLASSICMFGFLITLIINYKRKRKALQ